MSYGANGASPDLRFDDQRRLELLQVVAEAGGVLTPRRNPLAKYGHDFAQLGEDAETDLRYLADRDYLEARFFDRVSTCPSCASHHLNIREVCPACKSTHHAEETLLHHYRCGYVGRATDFVSPEGGNKRVCPKCSTALKYLGTDYDQMGKTFLCVDCGSSFQDPPVSASCLSCGAETDAADLTSVEINGYSLSSLGSAALRRRSFFESEDEIVHLGGAPVMRRVVLTEFLRIEARRTKRYRTGLSLIVLATREGAHGPVTIESELQALTRLRERIRDCDLLGQLADHRFAVCLPQTPVKGAELVRKRVAELMREAPFEISLEVLDIAKPEDLQALLGPDRA
jgi:hypothetical protein